MIDLKNTIFLCFSILLASLFLPFPIVAGEASIGEYVTRSDKSLIIEERHPAGQSLSDILITSVGFEHSLIEVLRDQNPINTVFVADLDSNGFDEFYIVTVSGGSGSYGNVIGFASNKDKSLSMISFPKVQEGDELFTGYMGHDIFSVANNKLTRSFPVYRQSDKNNNPTGGVRRLTYSLFAGEAGWLLRVTDSTNNI